MSDALLRDLAGEVGLKPDWVDADNRPQQAGPDVLRQVLEALGLPAQSPEQLRQSLALVRQERAAPPSLLTLDQGRPLRLDRLARPNEAFRLIPERGEDIEGRLDEATALPPLAQCGYYRLQLAERELTLAVAPPRCPQVPELCGGRRRAWGLAAQLYALREPGDGGLGDLAALEALARSVAAKGADALAISPLHAMFAAARQAYSPYSPSSRLFFNELHAAPRQVFGQAAVDRAIAEAGLTGELHELESLPLVDWPGSARARERLLRQLHASFARADAGLRRDFQRFRRDGGEALLQHCCFQALQRRRDEAGDGLDWRHWPAAYGRPEAEGVRRFLLEQPEEIDFQQFCQWLLARSLQHTQRAARDAGMGIGLIADLAVGADPRGSQAWMRQDELLVGVSVGAPPDVLNRAGQNWGICAFSPHGLRLHGYRAFIEMLRANLRYPGGLRIDHVLGLRRLWVIPEGAPPQAGAYLEYPLDDLLRLICLEAWQARALIVGEDLGTIPEGLRERLAEHGILGMRVLLFEQAGGHFHAPRQWSAEALATTSTHDLPSLEGWRQGHDIDWRERLGQRSGEQARQDREERQREVQGLARALDEDGIGREALDGAIEFVGRTPAPLVLLPLEDALGSVEQPNLPGPGDEHPNWRRRYPAQAGQMLDIPAVDARLQRLDQARREGER